VVVTCVATRANLPRLLALRDQFEAAGITFRVQPEKQDRDVIDYDDSEREQLIQLGGHNGTGEIAPSFAGQPCWAGAKYTFERGKITLQRAPNDDEQSSNKSVLPLLNEIE